MKIAAVSTILLQLPFRHSGPPLYFAGKPRPGMEMLLVRVDTDEGLTGWGEAFGPGIWPATRATIENLVAPLCIGRDPTRIAELGEDLQRKLHALGRAGSVIFALSGLDIALWDIAGKTSGKPLCRLLGEAPKSEVPAYASLLRYGEARLVAEKTAEAVSRGYRQVKLHEIGLVQTRAARGASGTAVDLMLDANCPWSVAEAVTIASELRDLNLLWLEEPIWPPEDFDGLAQVRREGGISTAAGENIATLKEFERLLAAHAVDYVQPSIIKMGGVSEFVKVFDLAARDGARVAPHSAYFGPGLLATLHVCASLAHPPAVERYYCDLDANPFGAAIDPINGRLAVPQGPGLGVDPDPAVLEKYRVA